MVLVYYNHVTRSDRIDTADLYIQLIHPINGRKKQIHPSKIIYEWLVQTSNVNLPYLEGKEKSLAQQPIKHWCNCVEATS